MLASQRPNFFLVGAPKCATTSMDAYLGQHPQIFMARGKESHFFARDLYPEGIGCSWDLYSSMFENVSGENIRGESSVFYLLSRTAAKDLAAFAPDAKILIMLRNPLDVLESHHSQIVYEGIESEKDVTTALRLETDRKNSCPSDRATYKERVKHYSDVVRFGEQLARFREHFTPEQIHTVIYDDLKADMAHEYAKVLAFLGVDTNFQPVFELKNANKTVRSATLRTLLYQTPEPITRLSRMVLPNYTLRRRVRNAIKRMNTNYQPRRPMAQDLRREIAQTLRADMENLSEALGRDLTPWLQDQALAPTGVPTATAPDRRQTKAAAAST
jgi:hypothetical protein